MAGDVQRVEPGALTGQATEMKGQNWHNPAEDAVTPPDALPSTSDAIANLNDNARSLKEFERWAEVENQRIAEMLEIAAQAYQKVDDDYGKAIENPERAAAVEAITIPEPPTQPPEIPSPAGTPRLLDASGYSNVNQTQAELTAPDAGTSLKTAMLQWAVASNRVENNKPKPPPGNWEGEAADAAYARMNTFGNWLTQLSEAWNDLAEAASKIVAAHDKAKSAHEPIYQEYTALEARMMQLASLTGPHGGVRVQREMENIRKRMEELQTQSDEVRQDYASSATFSPVRPADPPFKPAGGPTTTSGGGGGGGGAGDQPTGDPDRDGPEDGPVPGWPAAAARVTAGRRVRGRVAIGRWIALGRRRLRRQPRRDARSSAVDGYAEATHRSEPATGSSIRWRRIGWRGRGRRCGVGAAVARCDGRNGRTGPTHSGRRGARAGNRRGGWHGGRDGRNGAHARRAGRSAGQGEAARSGPGAR